MDKRNSDKSVANKGNKQGSVSTTETDSSRKQDRVAPGQERSTFNKDSQTSSRSGSKQIDSSKESDYSADSDYSISSDDSIEGRGASKGSQNLNSRGQKRDMDSTVADANQKEFQSDLDEEDEDTEDKY